jgi:hypothetical protein
MNLRRLSSGKLVWETYYDNQGRPKYVEYFDSRKGAIRLAMGPYWDGRDRSQSLGQVCSLEDFYDIIEWVMEYHQMMWWPDPRNSKLIWFRFAFSRLTPRAGDTLIGSTGVTYQVTHVARSDNGLPWNLSVLLDAAPATGEILRWAGSARDRNLIDFRAEYGSPSTPTPGEASEGDVGSAFKGVLRPTITYLLVRKEPFTLTGTPFGSSKELKPRVREQVLDPDRPQRVFEVLGQRMDNLIRFSCLHPRAETADALATWFERCINRQMPSIVANGIHRMLFWSSATLERRGKSGDDAAVRVVNYYVETEEVEVREAPSIRKLNVFIRPTSIGNINDLTGLATEPQWMFPFTGVTDESGNWLWGDIDIQDTRNTGTP